MQPTDLEIGRLSDDVDFVQLVERGQSGDISYSLIHVAPLLRYLGQKIKTVTAARRTWSSHAGLEC